MTNSNSALLTLAERVEAATEASRELDAEIAAALGAEVQRVTIGPDHRREELVTIDRTSGAAPTSRPVPRYTAADQRAATILALRARSAQ